MNSVSLPPTVSLSSVRTRTQVLRQLKGTKLTNLVEIAIHHSGQMRGALQHHEEVLMPIV